MDKNAKFLPSDLLSHIFSFLTNRHILSSCMLVDRLFMQSCATHLLQNQVSISSALASIHPHHHHDHHPTYIGLDQLDEKQFHTSHVMVVNAMSSEQIQNWSSDTLSMMFSFSIKSLITSLTLHNIQQSHIPVLEHWVKQLPNLNRVSISFNSRAVLLRELVDRILLPVIDQLECIELKSLGLYKQIDNDSFVRLFQSLVALKQQEQQESDNDKNNKRKARLKRVFLDGCYCFVSQDVDLSLLMNGMKELVLRDSMEKQVIYASPDANILHLSSHLTLLEFSYCGTIEYNNSLKSAMEYGCGQLRELRIYNSSIAIPIRIDENDPNRSFSLFPKLKTLSINAALFVDEAFFVSDPDWNSVFMRLESLEYVEIRGTKHQLNNLSSSNFSDVLKQCIGLKTLKMNKVLDDRLDSSIFNFLEEENIPRLYERVDLSETSIDSRALVNIIKYNSRLKELKATCSYSLHHQTSTDSYSMNFGSEFMLFGDEGADESIDQQKQAKRLMMDIVPHVNLKRVDLSNCVVSDSFLVYLLSVARNLEEINLEGAIRNEPLKADNDYPSDVTLERLRSVRLNGADISLCSFVLRQLEKLNPVKLTSLDMSGMVRVQTEFNSNDMKQMFDTLSSLLTHCTRLEKLNVNDYEWFDDNCLLALSSKEHAPLRRLHLSHTGASIDTISTLNLDRIQSLEAVGCCALSDLESIHHLLRKCSNVNKLTLDVSSTGICTETLQLIVTHCRQLTYLKIVGKQKRKDQAISEDSFTELFTALPALRFISLEFNPLSIQANRKLREQIHGRRFVLQTKIPHPENKTQGESQGWWSCVIH